MDGAVFAADVLGAADECARGFGFVATGGAPAFFVLGDGFGFVVLAGTNVPVRCHSPVNLLNGPSTMRLRQLSE